MVDKIIDSKMEKTRTMEENRKTTLLRIISSNASDQNKREAVDELNELFRARGSHQVMQ